MHNIKLTSLAMWFFDVIKNMMSSTAWKKRSQSWTISFLSIHTDETVRWTHENPCWLDTCRWSQLFFTLRCLQMYWGIQSRKSQLWRWLLSGSSSFGREPATCTFCEEIYWRKSTHKRLCGVVTGNETWLYFYGISNKRFNQMRVAADGKRPVLCFDQISRVRSDCFLLLPFFNTQGPLMVDILPQELTLTARYYVETVLSEVEKSIRQQRQTVGTSKTFLLHDHASAHKAKVAVTFLEKQNIQVLAHPSPYSPDSAQCDFWLVPHIIESWLGEAKYPGSGPSPLQSWLGSMWLLVGPPHRRKVGWWIFSRNQDLTKAVTSEHHALSLSDYQNGFWILAQTTGTVCAKRRRGLRRNVNVVGKVGPLLPVLLTCGHH